MTKTGEAWMGRMHQVSRLNFESEVRQQYAFREPVIVQDLTFVKMNNMHGARLYSADDYESIASVLDEAGVRETVFSGYFAGSPRDESVWAGLRQCAKLSRTQLKLRMFLFQESWRPKQYREEIDRLVDAGADAVIFHTFSGEESREARRELPEVVDYARRSGLGVAMSASNTTGSPIEPLIERLNEYGSFGVEHVELTDSLGCATPEATRYLIKVVSGSLRSDIPIWYHAHDQFGMATALALTATTAGAWPQVAVNGLGDNEFASLEEVVVALELLYDIRTGIEMEQLPRLSEVVATVTGLPVSPYKAIVGALITMPFFPSQYIGALAGQTPPQTRQNPYLPELVGRRAELTMSYSLLTRGVVEAALASLGLSRDPDVVARALGELRRRLDARGRDFPVLLDEEQTATILRRAAAESGDPDGRNASANR